MARPEVLRGVNEDDDGVGRATERASIVGGEVPNATVETREKAPANANANPNEHDRQRRRRPLFRNQNLQVCIQAVRRARLRRIEEPGSLLLLLCGFHTWLGYGKLAGHLFNSSPKSFQLPPRWARTRSQETRGRYVAAMEFVKCHDGIACLTADSFIFQQRPS